MESASFLLQFMTFFIYSLACTGFITNSVQSIRVVALISLSSIDMTAQCFARMRGQTNPPP